MNVTYKLRLGHEKFICVNLIKLKKNWQAYNNCTGSMTKIFPEKFLSKEFCDLEWAIYTRLQYRGK